MSTDTAGGDLAVDEDPVGERFYPLYRRLFDAESEFVDRIDRKLVEAKLPYTVEFYLSRALAIGLLLGFGMWLLGTSVGFVLVERYVVEPPTFIGLGLPESILPVVESLKVPFLIALTGIVFGTVGFATGFGAVVAHPFLKADARQREIDLLLADTVSYMYALSVGGLNQIEILKAVAEADDTYGEVAREFQAVVLETEYFDTDYRTAIQQQAEETPSDELSEFFTDMLSVVNSGGDMEQFLDDRKDRYMRIAKQEQERILETMELFSEMYLTLSLFPLLLVIVIVVMRMLGNAGTLMLYLTIYGLIPLLGLGFLVLVATIKFDEQTDGYLRLDGDDVRDDGDGVLDLGLVDQFSGDYRVFDRVKRREELHQVLSILRLPHEFFRDNPLYTLAITVPGSLLFLTLAMVTGVAPTGWDGVVAAPVGATFVYVYVPLFATLVPLGVFYEWNVRARRAVLRTLSEDLRKLASTNSTGLTLLESLEVVGENSGGVLADEFAAVHAQVNYGVTLREALVRFNNRYHIPRLARTVKLVSKAQEVSSHIAAVLSTAAQASENQDDLARDRKSRTRLQVVVIIVTFLTLLGVMAVLKVQFVDVMGRISQEAAASGGGGASTFGSIDVNLLSLLFFHAVTLQAVVSGLICGYIRDANLLSGVKYAVALLTVALAVWVVVG